MADLINRLTKLKTRRSQKRSIVGFKLNKLDALENENSLTDSFCVLQLNDIDTVCKEIKDLDVEILDLMNDNADNISADSFENEIEHSCEFAIGVDMRKDVFNKYKVSDRSSNSNKEFAALNESLTETFKNLNLNNRAGLPPPLKCIYFSDNQNDKFAFHTFIN